MFKSLLDILSIISKNSNFLIFQTFLKVEYPYQLRMELRNIR